MEQTTYDLLPGEVRIHERIPLSDEWLCWDPERMDRYPDGTEEAGSEGDGSAGVLTDGSEPAAGPCPSIDESDASARCPVVAGLRTAPEVDIGRRIELTVAHFLGAGFLVGLGVGLVFIGMGAIVAA